MKTGCANWTASVLLLLLALWGCPLSNQGEEPDTQPPVILLIGDAVITVPIGTPYVDPGVIATDDKDQDLTDHVVVLNPVDISAVGIYLITYNVSDSSGNAALEVTREVRVIDIHAPVITLAGEARIILGVGAIYNDPGATALDAEDGDLTAQIVTLNPVNTAAQGAYLVTYNVTDSAGNSALQATREVIVDGTAPVITLRGAASVLVAAGDSYFDAGATAVDDVEHDISNRIVTVNPVNTAVPGTYLIRYNVTDTAGNSALEVTREVTVKDLTAPVITLLGEARVIISANSVYVDAGATATDNVDGDITSRIVTVNPVDTSTLGTYTITYNVADTAGNGAQQVTREVTVVVFSLTFGGTKWDGGRSIIETSDGRYLLAGFVGATDLWWTWGDSYTSCDAVVIKLEESGNVVWNKTFGGASGDWAYSIIEVTTGGYAFAGKTSGTDNVFVVRMDVDGNVIWSKTFVGYLNNFDSGYSIIETSDGGFLIAGETERSANSDVWVIKIDANGNEIWNKRFAGAYDDVGQSVIETSDGNYVVAGYTAASGVGGYSAWVIKLDTDGNEVWNKTIAGALGYSIIEDSHGALVLTGTAAANVLVVKLDGAGNEIWSSTYDRSISDRGNSILEAADGSYVIAGTSSTSSSNLAGNDVWVIALDSNGNALWNRAFGGAGVDMGYSIIQASDGSFVLTGLTQLPGASGSDVWVIKF